MATGSFPYCSAPSDFRYLVRAKTAVFSMDLYRSVVFSVARDVKWVRFSHSAERLPGLFRVLLIAVTADGFGESARTEALC